MGLRFHKSFKLLPGIRLNMSKSGPSVSVGGKGLTYNFGSKRNRATVGLPGTGVSYSTTSSGRSKSSWFAMIVMVLAVGYAIFTAVSDDKSPLAHWTKIFSDKKDVTQPADGESEAAPPKIKHRRHPHSPPVE